MKCWPWFAGLALIGLLALWFFIGRPVRQRSKAKHDVDVLALTLDGFAREQTSYPRGTYAGVCALLRGETIAGQNLQRLDYVEAERYEMNPAGEFVDPWGTPYHVSTTPSARVYSSGPNRLDEQGQGDDIASWR